MCSVNSGRQTSAVHPLQAKSALGEVGPGAFCLGVGRTAADLIVLCLEARREAWGPWGHGSPGTAELHFGAADIAAQEMPSRILPVRWGQHVLPTQGTKEQVRSYLGIQEGRLHCEAVLGCPLGAVPEADLLAPEGSSLILRETIFQTLPGQHTVPRVTSYMLGSSRGRLGASQSLAGTG